MEKRTRVLPPEALVGDLLAAMQDAQAVPLVISGSSMAPFLVHGRDTAYLTKISKPIRRGDVVLYRHDDGQLVLHRVVKICGECFITRGDNCIEAEKITCDQIIGVMTEFCHKGKQRSVDRVGYRVYSRLWVGSYLARSFFKRLTAYFKRKFK